MDQILDILYPVVIVFHLIALSPLCPLFYPRAPLLASFSHPPSQVTSDFSFFLFFPSSSFIFASSRSPIHTLRHPSSFIHLHRQLHSLSLTLTSSTLASHSHRTTVDSLLLGPPHFTLHTSTRKPVRCWAQSRFFGMKAPSTVSSSSGPQHQHGIVQQQKDAGK